MYKPVPSKADFPALEHEILRFWKEHSVFETLVERNRGNERYSFIDGPITANNPMGVHHAWGRTYKDVYQRFWAMRGRDERYQNGFDCQGLWVEVEVEKALGLNSKKQIEEYGLDRFAEKCRERVLQYAGVITQQSIRLGQWMDWDHSYYTMSDNNIEHIWHFLKRCQDNGWLYKGWRTMPWCTRCGTSLSQHELIGTDSYREVIHPSLYVKFPLLDRPGESLMVWTTTPWTLPANVAAAVHPERDYVRVRVGDETLILSPKTLGQVFGKHTTVQSSGSDPLVGWTYQGGTPPEVVETIRGSELVGLRYKGPFDELPAQQGVEHRVIPWEDVGEEEGTGIVHIAPGCGAEDFALGQALGLPVLVPIDDNGDFVPGYGQLVGTNVHDVKDAVVVSLDAKKVLHKVAKIQHRYPTCWRCGEEIVFRGVSEWFVSAQEIRPRMIRAARTVEWTPSYAGKRMEDWLNNMQDWCISRKRYWGLPLPFYPCEQCEKLTVVRSVEELRSLAVDPAVLDGVRELHRPWIDAVKIRCPGCGSEVGRVTDVGDCWLDAGIVPFSTLGPGALKDPEEWAKWYPADWVSEMREQIRLWFYSMLFMSVTLEDRAPYKAVLVYEKLMDETGQPMHKSHGNAIWFEEAAERMGADVMRWLYAGQSLQSNLLFGYGPAEEVRRKLLVLWNVYSFFVGRAMSEGFRPVAEPSGSSVFPLGGEAPPIVRGAGEGTSPSPLVGEGWGEGWTLASGGGPGEVARTRMDRWILSQLDALVAVANTRLEAYDVAAVVDAADRFVDDLSTWYLRRGRARFSRAADPADRDAAFATLHESLVLLARIIAPIMPFMAEEMYQNLVRSWDREAPDSVHLTPYPASDQSRRQPDLDSEMELAREVVTLGRSARSEAGIRVRQPLPSITIASESASLQLSDELRREIADELNVKSVLIAENFDAFARRVVRPNPRLLGPKLGKQFPEVNQALQAGDYTIESDGSVSVRGHTLSPEEVNVSLEPRENQSVAQDLRFRGGIAVALDQNVTPELRNEGRVREVVHRVQTMRKDAGLNVDDRIVLGYEGSGSWDQLFSEYRDQILSAVGAEDLQPVGSVSTNGDGSHSWSGNLDDEEIGLALRRAGD